MDDAYVIGFQFRSQSIVSYIISKVGSSAANNLQLVCNFKQNSKALKRMEM